MYNTLLVLKTEFEYYPASLNIKYYQRIQVSLTKCNILAFIEKTTPYLLINRRSNDCLINIYFGHVFNKI